MRTHTHRLKTIALWIYILVILIFILLPVVYAFTGAFRGYNPRVWWENFWPVGFTTDNFALAFKRNPLGIQFVNSIIVTIVQAGAETILAILAAAALVFGRLKRPNLIFAFMLITMMIPGEAIIVSKFLLINKMNAFDTVAAVFLPYLTSAFSVFLLRQRFLSFPWEIYEAAQLDGIKPLGFVIRILIPISKPAIFMVAINASIAAWNGYLWPLLITESARTRTIQVGIKQLADAEALNMGVILAGVVIVTIPMILIILTGNKYLTRGLTEGTNK